MIRSTVSKALSDFPHLFWILKKADLWIHYALGIQYEPDFLPFKRIAEQFPSPIIADIGANIGQSAIGFAGIFSSTQIFSFEPNKELEKYLKFCKKLLGKSLNYRMVGVSDEDSVATLYIPLRGRIICTGEATVDRTLLNDPLVRVRVGSDFDVIERRIELVSFDQLGIEPDIVKIDVQGHELNVLKGMTNTISEIHPIILIERSQADSEIMGFLSRFGYKFFVADSRNQLVPYFQEAPRVNLFCLPFDAKNRLGIVSAIMGNGPTKSA